MARIMCNDQSLLIKLSATSMMLALASAKLMAFQVDSMNEIRQDIEFFNSLKQSYLDSAEDDKYFAEKFTHVSAEVDKMLIKPDDGNENY